jgi:Zn-dependent protease with chaperone function
MLWLGFADRPASAFPTTYDPMALVYLLLGMLSPVAIMLLWAKLLLRRYADPSQYLPTRRFNIGMLAARVMSLGWFGVCLYYFDFGSLVHSWVAPFAPLHVRLPGLLLATLPVWIAWIGFWWAAYPVDRAAREQSLLSDLDSGRYITAPPSLRDSIIANFRSQVLFILAPVLAAVVLRDVAAVLFYVLGAPMTGGWEALVFTLSILTVYVASPELLIRVLHAHKLPPSPLRSRLEAMAKKLNLRYRDIMIWHTNYGVGNAAVMGLVPRFRYILLTDLLLETLDDRQIEAVFAHEAGHVQHRHLLWYVVFIAIFMLASLGPADMAAQLFQRISDVLPVDTGLLIFLFTAGIFFTLFGMLARLFEKQADVYAARAMQFAATAADGARPIPQAMTPIGPDVYQTAVSSDGAESFVAALRRVAEVNHLPMNRPRRPQSFWAASTGHLMQLAMNFLHPSIPDRVDHLRELANDPSRTSQFDRKVVFVMLVMLLALMCLAGWAAVLFMRHGL